MTTQYKEIEEHFRNEYNNLVGKLTHVFNNKADAEDTVMDAFERAMKFYHTFDVDKGCFPTWFNVIIGNCIADTKRRERSRGMSANPDSLEDVENVGEATAEQSTLVMEILSYLYSKSPIVQQIVTLHWVYGLTIPEIVSITSYSTDQARKAIHRFKKDLDTFL